MPFDWKGLDEDEDVPDTHAKAQEQHYPPAEAPGEGKRRPPEPTDAHTKAGGGGTLPPLNSSSHVVPPFPSPLSPLHRVNCDTLVLLLCGAVFPRCDCGSFSPCVM